jgi:hypothetical protein
MASRSPARGNSGIDGKGLPTGPSRHVARCIEGVACHFPTLFVDSIMWRETILLDGRPPRAVASRPQASSDRLAINREAPPAIGRIRPIGRHQGRSMGFVIRTCVREVHLSNHQLDRSSS